MGRAGSGQVLYQDPHPLLVVANFILSISLHTIAINSQQIYQVQEIGNSFELSILKLQIPLQKLFKAAKLF